MAPKPSRLKVYVRIRPLNKKELESLSFEVLRTSSQRTHMLSCIDVIDGALVNSVKFKNTQYNFDRVFDKDCTNANLYTEAFAEAICQSCLLGSNFFLLPIGGSGSGKSWTIFGGDNDPGLALCAGRTVVDTLKGLKASLTFACVEFYKETLTDLLSGESLEGDASIPKIEFQTFEQYMKLVMECDQKRKVASTLANSKSSRSHLLFCISGLLNNKPFNIIIMDAAGWEVPKDVSKSLRVQLEGSYINLQLSALETVLMNFRENKMAELQENASFLKITSFLTQFLNETSRLYLIGNVSPASDCFGVTKCTLKFLQAFFPGVEINPAKLVQDGAQAATTGPGNKKEKITSLENELSAAEGEIVWRDKMLVEQRDAYVREATALNDKNQTLLMKNQSLEQERSRLHGKLKKYAGALKDAKRFFGEANLQIQNLDVDGEDFSDDSEDDGGSADLSPTAV